MSGCKNYVFLSSNSKKKSTSRKEETDEISRHIPAPDKRKERHKISSRLNIKYF